jgi:hypothetical protein
MIRVRRSPALPTKGLPCTSSSFPGASPTKTSLTRGFPSPKTDMLALLGKPAGCACTQLLPDGVKTSKRPCLSAGKDGRDLQVFLLPQVRLDLGDDLL